MNLPNAITVARIAATPAIALLPFVDSWSLRLAAFVLYIVAAVTDYYDGMLARTRGQITDLGKQLDPLADKLLLVGTFVPMFLLTANGGDASLLSPHQEPFVPGVLGPTVRPDGEAAFPVHFPGLPPVGLPWWILAIVVGRELFMTLFRSAAARRGTVIAAIGPAKWKTGFQSTWVGAAYFWFFAATLAAEKAWTHGAWRAFAQFNGLVVVVTMVAAVALTVWTMWLYLRRYGWIFTGRGAPTTGA